ncbi:RtcB family protein [Amycolatopsis nivea]|uniref:RtcB family protein n=2 Tax=Amycolatopsis TaxID=1813 RepID=UPI0030B83BB2
MVMTDAGSRPISELSGGVHTVLTEGGEWVKAPVRSFGQQPIWEVVIGRFGEERTIRTTREHRWLLRPKTAHNRTEATTEGLRVGDRLAYVFPARSPGLMPSREGIARGFVFGDGSISGRGMAHADFYGKKDEALLPFFDRAESVRTYYYTYSSAGAKKKHVTADDVQALRSEGVVVGTMKRLGGLPREWKREYPRVDGPPAELYGWLAGYFAADGEVGKTGRPAIWSANRQHLVFFKEACDSLGIWTLPIRRRVRTGFGSVDTPVFVMGLSRADLTPEFFIHDEHRARWEANRDAVERRGWTVRAVRATDEIEEVFCAVVEDTHSFALDGNILTGNCHHNYVAEETYDGVDLLVTRKGAIRAGSGDLGIIPGSMGTGSYIVRGLGNTASFESASHGAGRRMSRTKARKTFTAADLAAQTAGVECRKDTGVVDEIPAAYKDIETVIQAQTDLVEVVAHLKQVVCVKG